MSVLSLIVLFSLLDVACHCYLYQFDDYPVEPSALFYSSFSRQRRDNDKIRRCGRVLSEAVKKHCNGCTKPSGDNDEDMDLRKRSAFSYVNRNKRGGLASQCCVSACSVEDIKKHCCV